MFLKYVAIWVSFGKLCDTFGEIIIQQAVFDVYVSSSIL